jgi:probable phosphoglycerate mutase
MSVFRALLVRHAEHVLQDRVLVGRMPGIPLSTRGGEQARILARILARALRNETIALVQSSPRERCRETAEEVCRVLDVSCAVEDALDEIDFGAWTGARFDMLEDEPEWRGWNAHRNVVRPPGGESMHEAQQRILQHLGKTASCVAGAVVMVTHAEIIRAALLHERKLPLQAWSSIAIAPGSVNELTHGRDANALAGVRGAAA